MLKLRQVDLGQQQQQQQKQNLPALGASTTPVSKLQQSLDQLNRLKGYLTDDELWQKYSELFIAYFGKQRFMPPIENQAIQDENMEHLFTDWISLLDVTHRVKAYQFINDFRHALQKQNKWSVHSNGKVLEKGIPIEGHIIDHFIYMIKKSRGSPPPSGYNEFKNMLQDLGFPSELVKVSLKRGNVATSPPNNKRIKTVKESENQTRVDPQTDKIQFKDWIINNFSSLQAKAEENATKATSKTARTSPVKTRSQTARAEKAKN